MAVYRGRSTWSLGSMLRIALTSAVLTYITTLIVAPAFACSSVSPRVNWEHTMDDSMGIVASRGNIVAPYARVTRYTSYRWMRAWEGATFASLNAWRLGSPEDLVLVDWLEPRDYAFEPDRRALGRIELSKLLNFIVCG